LECDNFTFIAALQRENILLDLDNFANIETLLCYCKLLNSKLAEHEC